MDASLSTGPPRRPDVSHNVYEDTLYEARVSWMPWWERGPTTRQSPPRTTWECSESQRRIKGIAPAYHDVIDYDVNTGDIGCLDASVYPLLTKASIRPCTCAPPRVPRQLRL